MKEKIVLFLLLVVTHLLSASKPTKLGSKIAKHLSKVKVRKSKSVAGHLVRTNKEKVYLAKGSKKERSRPRKYEKEGDMNGTRKYEEGDYLSRPRKYEERDKKSGPRNYEKDYNINGPRKYGEEDNINGPRKYGEEDNINGPRKYGEEDNINGPRKYEEGDNITGPSKYEEEDNINGPSKYGNYLPDSRLQHCIGAITVYPSPRQCIVTII